MPPPTEPSPKYRNLFPNQKSSTLADFQRSSCPIGMQATCEILPAPHFSRLQGRPSETQSIGGASLKFTNASRVAHQIMADDDDAPVRICESSANSPSMRLSLHGQHLIQFVEAVQAKGSQSSTFRFPANCYCFIARADRQLMVSTSDDLSRCVSKRNVLASALFDHQEGRSVGSLANRCDAIALASTARALVRRTIALRHLQKLR